MNMLRKVLSALQGKPATPEELAALVEAHRVQDEVLNERLSQESGAGQLYQSGRGRDD